MEKKVSENESKRARGFETTRTGGRGRECGPPLEAPTTGARDGGGVQRSAVDLVAGARAVAMAGSPRRRRWWLPLEDRRSRWTMLSKLGRSRCSVTRQRLGSKVRAMAGLR
ncbi:proline-rich receptor-like protein kinase PERK9 [Iris pallida]|uniref:Proline-rich receptor-like protein kinase PERK9 n=1 Tax=Iris pallida TaxID=29817 RepID=A0AAX6H7G8_IRIPA|nr:proline-rich receptor-like protein kinase PERK9 [Iris pallida]KAJ6849123.1 proline-rich receptor-like protein kinase PERK9 [Iris pallida]